MGHPKNKFERRKIGNKKGKKRVQNFYTETDMIEHPEWLEENAKHHRDTSKTCSCYMCGNPRKYFNEKTIQERKVEENMGL